MQDYQDTPVGERMPGSEIHAQLIENLLAGTLLRRPAWATVAEAALLLLFGALLSGPAALAALPVGAAAAGAAVASMLAGRRASAAGAGCSTPRRPAWALIVLFIVLLLDVADRDARQRRSLERDVQAAARESARVAGELEAAQRIQRGSLPRADLLQTNSAPSCMPC